MRSFGLGFIFIPVSVLALSGVSSEQRDEARGLFNLTRELGGSFGTALMGMLVSDGVKIHRSFLAEAINPYHPLVQARPQQIAISLDLDSGLYGCARVSPGAHQSMRTRTPASRWLLK